MWKDTEYFKNKGGEESPSVCVGGGEEIFLVGL